jgi:hypothetical protein
MAVPGDGAARPGRAWVRTARASCTSRTLMSGSSRSSSRSNTPTSRAPPFLWKFRKPAPQVRRSLLLLPYAFALPPCSFCLQALTLQRRRRQLLRMLMPKRSHLRRRFRPPRCRVGNLRCGMANASSGRGGIVPAAAASLQPAGGCTPSPLCSATPSHASSSDSQAEERRKAKRAEQRRHQRPAAAEREGRV